MWVAIGVLSTICLALSLWIRSLVKQNERESHARIAAESERTEVQRKCDQDVMTVTILLVESREREDTLRTELQDTRRGRDEALHAESISRENFNRASFDLAQKDALMVILFEKLEFEAGEHAYQKTLREHFECDALYRRSLISGLNAELARARTKEARTSIIESFLSHLAGGLADA